MKIFNKVDLQELKDKTTLESLEKNNAILLKDSAIKEIKIEVMEMDIADIMFEIADILKGEI